MLNWAMTYLVRWNQSTFIPPFFVNVAHEYITYQDVGLMLVCRLLLGLKQNASEVEGGLQTDFHCGASQWPFGSTTVLSVDGSLVGKSWWLAIRLPQVLGSQSL